MASMSEMLQTAIAVQERQNRSSRSGRLAGLVEAALRGTAAATEDNRKMDEERRRFNLAAPDRELKQLQIKKAQSDIEKQQAEMEREAAGRRAAENYLKSRGLIPLDDKENDSVRSGALETIAPAPTHRPHNNQGRLAEAFGALPDGYEETISVNPADPLKSLRVSIRKGKPTKETPERDQSAKMERIRKAAQDMARKDKFNTYQQLYGPEVAQARFSNVQPTEDEVARYIPEVTEFLEGRPDGAKAPREKRRREQAMRTLTELGPQFEEISQVANKGFFNTAAKKAAQADLENMKRLFSGPEFDELDKHLSAALIEARQAGRLDVMRGIAERLQKLRQIRSN